MSDPIQPRDEGESSYVNEIVTALKSGRNIEGNARRLFNLYYEKLCYFFQRRGCTVDDSRDLTQESLLRVYSGIPRFREESSFETWLLQVASNVWINELRSRSAAKRDAQVIELDASGDRPVELADPSRETDALTAVLTKERRATLRVCIAELPPRMRECLLLRIDQGLKYRQIASVMRLSMDTVKSQIQEAKKRLVELAAVGRTEQGRETSRAGNDRH